MLNKDICYKARNKQNIYALIPCTGAVSNKIADIYSKPDMKVTYGKATKNLEVKAKEK